MKLFLFIISLCAIIIQVHREEDMILDFKEVSIPTKILIFCVFVCLVVLIFTNDFFKSSVTFHTFLTFVSDIWFFCWIAIGLGWILLENLMKRPIRLVKSNSDRKHLIYSMRFIGVVCLLIYIFLGFHL